MGPKQARGRIHNVATPELKAPPMNRIRRFLVRGLLAFLGLLAVLAALLAYFIYTPDPELPQLSGTLSKASMNVDGVERSYRSYVP
jgi:polyhydroxybutyrate depolymerase